MLQGISHVTDDRGNKLAVQIDLRKHRSVWEDFQDVLVAESRRAGSRQSITHKTQQKSCLATRFNLSKLKGPGTHCFHGSP